MSEKKPEPINVPLPAALCSPPSHPTTLGNVWVGMSCPTPGALAMALASEAQQRSDKSRGG